MDRPEDEQGRARPVRQFALLFLSGRHAFRLSSRHPVTANICNACRVPKYFQSTFLFIQNQKLICNGLMQDVSTWAGRQSLRKKPIGRILESSAPSAPSAPPDRALTLLSTSERDGSCGGSFLASYVDDGELNHLNQFELNYYCLFIERGEIISLIIRDIDICQNNGLKDINN